MTYCYCDNCETFHHIHCGCNCIVDNGIAIPEYGSIYDQEVLIFHPGVMVEGNICDTCLTYYVTEGW